MKNTLSDIINSIIIVGISTLAMGSVEIESQQPSRNWKIQMKPDEIECLAKNIYWEARNQSELGQVMVGWVTLNRVAHERYPNTICEVVYEPYQFSWTIHHKNRTPGDNEIELKAWRKANRFAQLIAEIWEIWPDPTKGAIMFHATHVSPYWKDSYIKTIKEKDHIFYRESTKNQ